ncbi:hypothetical protein ACHWQZ_G014332 [Mnemiopsis leidyi]
MRKDGRYTDFSLKVDSQVIPCHKAVLVALIPYFDSMFSSNLFESQANIVSIKDMKSEILQMVIDFSYSGEISMTQSNVEDVLRAASFFQIYSLRNACCKYLTQLLATDNAIGIYCFAEKFSCTQLQEAAFRYILHNFGLVSIGEEFLSLDAETLIKIISEDKLKSSSEEQVYTGVVRWVRHDLHNRKDELHRVMSFVRFGLMSRDKLAELSQGEESLLLIINQLSSKSYPLRHPHNQPRDPQRLSRRIFIAGGIAAGVHSALSEVQSYNPDTDTWENLTSLTFPRFGAGLVSRLGSLYMLGGHTGSSYISSVEKYDFEGNCWVTLPGIYGPSRRYFSTVGVDGKIMIMGGCDTASYMDTAAVLDIPSKQLIFAGKLNEQRVYCGSCVLNDIVYVVGGYGMCRQFSRLNTAERYDQLTGCWEPIASLKEPRSGLGVVAIGRKMYALGGFDGKNYLNSVEEYDPKTDVWKTISPMKHARRAHGTAAINGYIYVYGGFDGTNFLKSVERYDPCLKIWESMKDMPLAKAYFGSTVL